MTAPYAAAVAERLPFAVKHELSITAEPEGAEPFELDVETLTITFAEDWSPYAQASISCKLPDDPARLSELDPRRGCRLRIRAGYSYGGTSDVQELADLDLRTRAVNRPGGTLELTASSDEARTQDNKLVYHWNPDITGINELTRDLLDYALRPEIPVLVSSYPEGSDAADLVDFEINVGDDLWSALYDGASRAGHRLYCDEYRTWRLTGRPSATGTVRHALTVGESGTLIETSSELGREDWHNAVCLHFKWTELDGSKYERIGNASVTSGEFAALTVGRKVHFEAYDQRRIGLDTARKIAASRLATLASRGRSLTVHAIAAYWLRPGMTVSITLPTGAAEDHLIRSISFAPAEGTMSIVTRQPVNAEISTGE